MIFKEFINYVCIFFIIMKNDMINVGGELGSSDAGYFSTSPQIPYQPRTPTTAQQLTPQTPTIILTGK